MMFGSFDTHIVLWLNGLLATHYWLAKLANGFALNPIARGVPVFAPLIVVWFSGLGARGRMVLGLFGTCLATMISVMLQRHLHVDVRPFFNPALHLYKFGPEDLTQWGRINSFPSDTATLYFALSTVIFLEWRAGGILAYAWSFVTTGICRAALGFHYPSDILAGIILGVSAAYLFSRFSYSSSWVQRHMEQIETRKAWIHAALFLLLADAYSQFAGLQGVMRLFVDIGHSG